jgi:hypothetical protein
MASLKSRLRTAVIGTVIASSMASGTVGGLPERFKIDGETMVADTQKVAEKRDDKIFRELANKLYGKYSKFYKGITGNDYYNYVSFFSIKTEKAFNDSTGVDKSVMNLGKMKETLASAKEQRRAETAPARAAEREKVKQIVAGQGLLGAVKAEKPAAVIPQKTAEAPSVTITGAYSLFDVPAIFETDKNAAKDASGNIMKNESGNMQYAYPPNINALTAFRAIDYEGLKRATGMDFLAEIRKGEEKGDGRSAERISTMIGAIVIYNAFVEKEGKVKGGQLKAYCGDDGYAENLGRAMSVPLSNHGDFTKEVMSFLGAYIKDGKLVEITGEGKDEKGQSNAGRLVYSVAAVSTSCMGYVRNWTISSQINDNWNRIADLEAQKAKTKTIKDANQRIAKMGALEKEINTRKADIQVLTDMKQQKSMLELYSGYKREILGMARLDDYIAKLDIPNQFIKKQFRDDIRDNNVQMVLLQKAIEEASPIEKEKGDVWKSYKTLVIHELTKLAMMGLSKEDRHTYRMLNNRYRNAIDDIYDMLGSEETARFIVDLADPKQAKKSNMKYGDYITKKIMETWMESVSTVDAKGNAVTMSCLDKFRKDFEEKYKAPLDRQAFPDKIISSLVVEHGISVGELDFVMANSGSLGKDKAVSALYAKLNDAKKNFANYGSLRDMVNSATAGINDPYKGRFRDIVLLRFAILDVTNVKNPIDQAKGTLTPAWITKKEFTERTKKITDGVNSAVPPVQVPISLPEDEKTMRNDKARTDRANVFLELFNNEFKLMDDRYNKIPVSTLETFRLQLEVLSSILKGMDASHFVTQKGQENLKEDCIYNAKFMANRLADIIAANRETGIAMRNEVQDEGDRMLLDIAIKGRVVIAGPKGFDVYDDMAPVNEQAFIPVMFYFVNHRMKLFDMLMGMDADNKTSKFINVKQSPGKVVRDIEAEMGDKKYNFRTEGWKVIMDPDDRFGRMKKGVERQIFNTILFSQALEYFSKPFDAYNGKNYGAVMEAFDSKAEAIFGKDIVENLNGAVKNELNFCQYAYQDTSPNHEKLTGSALNRMAIRMKMLCLSNLVLEAPYYDLSTIQPSYTDPSGHKVAGGLTVYLRKEIGKPCEALPYADYTKAANKDDYTGIRLEDNRIERWIDGYTKAREGIPVNKEMAANFINNIGACKWMADLEFRKMGKTEPQPGELRIPSGDYTIEFDDGKHGVRAFDVKVTNVMGDRATSQTNIKIEPMTTLDGLLGGNGQGTFSVYAGDKITIKSKVDKSIALVSKSNVGALFLATVNAERTGFKAPSAKYVKSMMDDNFVPNGFHEQGIQPTSYYGGLYFAITKPQPPLEYISKRNMSVLGDVATYTPIVEIRPIRPAKVEASLAKVNLNLESVIRAPSGVGINGSYTDANGVVHDWFTELAGATGKIDENGNATAMIINRATGQELTFGDLRAVLTSSNVNINPTGPSAPQWNTITDQLYGTNAPPDNAKIEVRVDSNGNAYIVLKGDQNGLQVNIGTISRETVSVLRYGYLNDRFRVFLATEGQIKAGNQVINLRLEAGKKISDFDKIQQLKVRDSRTAIVNAFLSANLLGAGWKKDGWTLLAAQPYLLANFEDIANAVNARTIEAGAGIGGIVQAGRFDLRGGAQVAGLKEGAGKWELEPGINLYNTYMASNSLDIYQTAYVRYAYSPESREGALRVAAGGGLDWSIGRYTKIGIGGLYEKGPVNMTSLMFDIGYKRVALETITSFQRDEQWGPDKIPGIPGVTGERRGVLSGKVMLTYRFGTIDLTKKKKGGKK